MQDEHYCIMREQVWKVVAEVVDEVAELWPDDGRYGYELEKVVAVVLIMFLYDKSLREMEDLLRHHYGFRYVCRFELGEETPDYSTISKWLSKLEKGEDRVEKAFRRAVDRLRGRREVELLRVFIDSSKMRAMVDTWKVRDRMVAELETRDDEVTDMECGENAEGSVDNTNVAQYSTDPDARYGCKGEGEYWLGYKRNVAVCMETGLIVNHDVRQANVHDSKTLMVLVKDLPPCEVYADKGYCSRKVEGELESLGCRSMIIKRDNMKDKDRERDKMISKLRAPFERVFRWLPNVTRYRGLVKNRVIGFFQALAYNVRVVVRKSVSYSTA